MSNVADTSTVMYFSILNRNLKQQFKNYIDVLEQRQNTLTFVYAVRLRLLKAINVERASGKWFLPS